MQDGLQICRCNKCDIYMKDENPDVNQKMFSREELENIPALNIIPMERDENEHHVVCPVCKNDGDLVDITSIEDIKVSWERVPIMGWGFTEKTAMQQEIGFFNLKSILDHDAWHSSYSDCRYYGYIRVLGFHYHVADILKEFCVLEDGNGLSHLYDIDVDNLMNSFDEKPIFIVEVKDEHYIH